MYRLIQYKSPTFERLLLTEYIRNHILQYLIEPNMFSYISLEICRKFMKICVMFLTYLGNCRNMIIYADAKNRREIFSKL